MRHRLNTTKLQRNSNQRRALLANLACNLIEFGRIKTTLAKAKALRPIAEKMVTLGKKGDINARRRALAFLRHKSIVKELFDRIAPVFGDRAGGYCRILQLGSRQTDSAKMAYIEWVDLLKVSEKSSEKENEKA